MGSGVKIGNQYTEFDGSVSYVNLGRLSVDISDDGDVAQTCDPFLLSFWIKPLQGTGGPRFLGVGSGFHVRYSESSENVSWRADSASNGPATAPDSVPLNKWTHVAFRRTPERLFEAYVNGELSSSVDNPSNPSSASWDDEFHVGNYGSEDSLVGKLDDVRLYKTCGCAALIKTIFEETKHLYWS